MNSHSPNRIETLGSQALKRKKETIGTTPHSGKESVSPVNNSSGLEQYDNTQTDIHTAKRTSRRKKKKEKGGIDEYRYHTCQAICTIESLIGTKEWNQCMMDCMNPH